MNTHRLLCGLLLNVLVLGGTMFPEDKKPAQPPTDPGWHELRFYRKKGNSSARQAEVKAIEEAINGALTQIPGIDCVKLNPVFGSGGNRDMRLVLRYKVGENKDRKPPHVKLFDLLDISYTDDRKADDDARDEFYEKNARMTLYSDADYYYDGRHLTILIYDPAP